MGQVVNREDAWDLMCEWTESDSLRKHMLAVEAAMRAYARRFGEDEEKWGVTGLLHDMDYEKYPTQDGHPMVGVRELERLGYPEDVLHAIKGHADYLDVPRDTPMSKTLYAVDELSGFIVACAMVRPEGLEKRPQEDEAEVFRRCREPRRHRKWRRGAWRRPQRAHRVRGWRPQRSLGRARLRAAGGLETRSAPLLRCMD